MQELHRTGGNRDSTPGGCIQGPMCTRTQGKSSDFIETWVRLSCWSWRVSKGSGDGCGSPWGHGHSWWRCQGVFICLNSCRGRHLAWDISTETWPHTSADRLPKDFLNPQPPLDMLLDTVLPTKGPRPRSTHHGQAVAPPFRKPAPASSTRGQTPEARELGSRSLQN